MEASSTEMGARRRSTTIRRRPSVLRSRLPMKSNPYIGWFRHAPPSLGQRRRHTMGHKKYRLSTEAKQFYAPSALQMKNSPYIGWFRHAPPSRLHVDKKKYQALLEQEISKLLETLPKKADGSCSHRVKFVSGRLPGGSPCEDDDMMHVFPPLTWLDSNVSESLRRSLQETSIVSGSATVKVLTRLAYWFLFPLAHDATDYPSCHDDKSETHMLPRVLPKALQGILEDEEDAYYQREPEMDDDNMTAVSEISEDDLGASISSLAEAYHAHQRAEASRQNDLLLYEGHHRLDYVVTQMDIARMAKNASRHLDVESILNLPTVTYRSESPPAAPTPAVPEHERTEEEGWSWMIVPPNPDSQENPPPKKDGEEQNFCVICLEHFVDGDRLRVLPCDHLFHMGCIDRWLSGTYSDEDCITSGCPTCKKRPELQEPPSPDGSVPSWAFSRVGDALARDSLDLADS